MQFTVVHLMCAGYCCFLIVGSVLQFFGDIGHGFYVVHILMFRFCDGLYKHYFPALVPRDTEDLI